MFGMVTLAAHAQTALAFEVASVKPTELPTTGRFGFGQRIDYAHGLFACDYCNLETLVTWAFSVKKEQISGSDSLDMSAEYYQIEARMAPGTTKEQVPPMLRNLLDERFHLKVHREEKEVQVYALVASEKGVRLQAAEPATDSRSRLSSGPGFWSSTRVSMQGLASALARDLDRPVVDKTGIEGWYNVSLKWAPESGPLPADVEDRPGIFTAVRELLGLELKKDKARMEFLVVDHLDRKPTAN
jgi:uncharacterized protein (TIGR03435 family)